MPRRSEDRDDLPEQAGRFRRPDNAYGDEVEWHSGLPFRLIWALTAAAAVGDALAIRKLATDEPDLIRYHHIDAMPFAVQAGHIDAVRVMIDLGAFDVGYVEMHRINDMIDAAEIRGRRSVLDLLDGQRRSRWHYRPEANDLAGIIKDRALARVAERMDADPDLVHAADDYGNAPMHWAALTGQLALVDLLLDRGADINVVRCDGARPVDLARGDYDYRLQRDASPDAPQDIGLIVGYFIARGADYDIVVAADCGDLGRVKALLAEDRSRAGYLPPYHNWYTGSPLKCAAAKGHTDIVKVLLESGADPNMPEPPIAPDGIAIYDAASKGHVDVVRLLLDHGARANVAVDSCPGSLEAALSNEDTEMVELLRKHGAEEAPSDSLSAAHYGDAAEVRRVIAEQPDLAYHGYLGYIIRCAAERNDREVLQAFMDTVPDLFDRVVVSRGSAKTLRWLLDAGMNPNLADWVGWTSLHELAERNDSDAAAVFVEYGANLEAADAVDASTPLGIAARKNRAVMVRWLLDAGADSNGGAAPWATPLAWAMRCGHDGIEKLLRERGAS